MSYTPTEWATGDVVTAQKLNKLENGLASVASDADDHSAGVAKVIASVFENYADVAFSATSAQTISKLMVAPPNGTTFKVKLSASARISLIGHKSSGNTVLVYQMVIDREYTVTLTDSYDYLGLYSFGDITNGHLIFWGDIYTKIHKETVSDAYSKVFNEIEMISGEYIRYSSGEVSNSGSAKRTDYTDCRDIYAVYCETSIGGVGACIAFYSENMVYMSDYSVVGNDHVKHIYSVVPAGAAYFVVSGYNYTPYVVAFSKIKINNLLGKKIMFFGDSITDDPARYRNDLIALTGLNTVESFAVSQATLTNASDTVMDGNPTTSANNTVPNQVQKLLNGTFDTPDVVIVSAGTNDDVSHFAYSETQFIDNGDYIAVGDCNLTNVSGAMRWIYEKIMSVYPNAQVFFATPIQAAEATRPFSEQKTKHDSMVQTAERMSVEVIDAFYKSGIYGAFENQGASGKYLADGLHPNSAGAKVLAACYSNAIKNNARG